VTLQKARVYLGLSYVVTVWALNTVAVKFVLHDWQPLAFTGLRFICMVPLAFLLAKLLGERVHIERRDVPLLLACGAAGYGVYQYLWVLGLAHTTAFASALLATLSPLMTLAIVAIRGHERVNAGRWIGAVIALLGVAIFEGAFAGHATFRTGDGLTLVSAAVFACFNVISARLLDRYTPVGLLVISMMFGSAMILPGAIPQMMHQNWYRLTPVDWGIFAYALIFPILLTYPVWSYGISRLGAARTSLFQFGVPIIAGVLSVVLLGARIEAHQAAGAVLCIAGVAISQMLGRVPRSALWAARTQGMER
jgi:drug/metabolite transporter (DMT)-like permease